MSDLKESTVSWQQEFSKFFRGIGLLETSKCFDSELAVLSQYNRERIPGELEKLVDKLLRSLEQHVEAKETMLDNPKAPIDENKLLYTGKRKRTEEDDDDSSNADQKIKLEERDDDDEQERIKRMDSEQVQIRATQSEMQQRIDTFIQAKRQEVDASNRAEFLSRPDPSSADVTCARTDAREINRNIQMKLDIVNNEDGPLARSLLSSSDHVRIGEQPSSVSSSLLSSNKNQHEGAIERIKNIEQHLNVSFDADAQPPFSLYERIKILEDTLMEIERKHPKWAAVYFNQPNRTFPPPPPEILINRPENNNNNNKGAAYVATQAAPQQTLLRTTGRANSSLTRAVIEQLNRQRQTF